MTRQCQSSYAHIPIAPSQMSGTMLSANTNRATVYCPRCGRELRARANRHTYIAQIPRHNAPEAT